MKHLKRYTIIGIIFVLITGTLAHFLYDWTGNNDIVGLFTPIMGTYEIAIFSNANILAFYYFQI